ncbi:hypothetical protein MKX01_014310 [Papaver californicum]|nr:hypothetical protein MKX01_014310 [Papaver californicum]
MESLARRRVQPAAAILFVFLFLFISLNQLLETINSDHQQPAGRPPSPVPNTNKHFEVPPGPPSPQDNGQ